MLQVGSWFRIVLVGWLIRRTFARLMFVIAALQKSSTDHQVHFVSKVCSCWTLDEIIFCWVFHAPIGLRLRRLILIETRWECDTTFICRVPVVYGVWWKRRKSVFSRASDSRMGWGLPAAGGHHIATPQKVMDFRKDDWLRLLEDNNVSVSIASIAWWASSWRRRKSVHDGLWIGVWYCNGSWWWLVQSALTEWLSWYSKALKYPPLYNRCIWVCPAEETFDVLRKRRCWMDRFLETMTFHASDAFAIVDVRFIRAGITPDKPKWS